MLYEFIKKIYHLFLWPVHHLRQIVCYKYINFAIPNLKPTLLLRIKFVGKQPICQQKTLITGLGIVEIGENCSFGYKLGGFHRGGSIEFQPRYKAAIIKIGNNVTTNNNLFFCAANYIEIGGDTLIGQNVTIMDHEAHGIDPLHRRKLGVIGEVIIGKNVWIGNNVTILKNSTIGENSIIATGAVVSGKFPANVIIGGVPAKIIKSL
jgi:acetyltransferase-like isoleucine patch superfamily enzyme